MAGSLRHILHGWTLIENMGDAHEAIEELMWLVLSQIGPMKAKKLIKEQFTPMYSGKLPEDKAYRVLKKMMGR